MFYIACYVHPITVFEWKGRHFDQSCEKDIEPYLFEVKKIHIFIFLSTTNLVCKKITLLLLSH